MSLLLMIIIMFVHPYLDVVWLENNHGRNVCKEDDIKWTTFLPPVCSYRRRGDEFSITIAVI